MAALMVAAFHTREITWVGLRAFWQMHGLHASPGTILGYLTFPLIWGVAGVPVFFVLSGYCIHRGQAIARAAGTAAAFPASNYLVRRFFRIYPVLAGALAVTFLCDSLSRQFIPNSGKLGDLGFHALFVNLASLQGLAGPTYGSNIPLWTMSVEVQFYILYPVLLIAMSRLGNISTLAIIAALNVLSYFVCKPEGYTIFASFYVSWYLGALVAEYEARGLMTDNSSTRVRASLYAASIFVSAAGCVIFFLSAYLAFQVWAVGFAIFLFAFLRRPNALAGRTAGFFRWLGTFSFSLYIVHMPVVVLVHSFLFRSLKQESLLPFIATLAVAVAVAYAFSFVFERPALALSKMWKIKRSRQPAAAPA